MPQERSIYSNLAETARRVGDLASALEQRRGQQPARVQVLNQIAQELNKAMATIAEAQALTRRMRQGAERLGKMIEATELELGAQIRVLADQVQQGLRQAQEALAAEMRSARS